jgi:hypothetical protein
VTNEAHPRTTHIHKGNSGICTPLFVLLFCFIVFNRHLNLKYQISLIKMLCSTYPKLDSSPNQWIGSQLQLDAVCTLHLHLDLTGKLHLTLCSANKMQLQLLAVILQALHVNQYNEGMDSSFYSPPSPYNYQCECKSFLEMTGEHTLRLSFLSCS